MLTQFNSTSLHRHISSSYKFDIFSRSFVEILAAQQTPEGSTWYQGTADAVRQNLRDFLQRPYRVFHHPQRRPTLPMDYRLLLAQHIAKNADITIATIPVGRAAATDFGIMHSDPEHTHIPVRGEAEDRRPAG